MVEYEEEIEEIKILIYICLLGIVSVLFMLPTFLISKLLRAHPSKLILYCCIGELAYCYTAILLYFMYIYELSEGASFDLYEMSSYVVTKCTFGVIHMSTIYITNMLNYINILSIMIVHMCYICLSLDLILIIRNPFYPAHRRMKIYSATSFLLPLIFCLFGKKLHKICLLSNF